MGSWAKEIWGEDWRLDADNVRAVRKTEEPFPTRRAALIALEAALSEASSAIGDML